MRGTANTSTGGRFCGRAVHGISNLSSEDMRQIEAHRHRDRPTPWPHLAVRFGVNEIDLRRLFEPKNDNASDQLPAPRPDAGMPPAMLPALWNAGVSLAQISLVLKMDERSVARMRERLGLAPRKRGDGLAQRRALGDA